MRKTLIALAAATGLVGFGTVGALAAPVPPAHVPAQTANTQQVDWYSGPRSDWRHSRGEGRNEWREHHSSYGYNHDHNRGYSRDYYYHR